MPANHNIEPIDLDKMYERLQEAFDAEREIDANLQEAEAYFGDKSSFTLIDYANVVETIRRAIQAKHRLNSSLQGVNWFLTGYALAQRKAKKDD